MTVKGWLRCSVFYFYFILKAVSQALLSLLRCFYFSFWWWRSWGGGTLSSASPRPSAFFFLFLMYHRFFIFLFTKRIMLFVLSTVKQSLLRHWKAISLYETFTMYLLWLTFDSSSLLFTCTLGVIIEVNLFYTNTKRVRWRFLFSPSSIHVFALWFLVEEKYSQRKRRVEVESEQRYYHYMTIFVRLCCPAPIVCRWVSMFIDSSFCMCAWLTDAQWTLRWPLFAPPPTATRRPLRSSAGRVLVGGADQRRAEGAHPEAGARPEHHPGHVLPAAARRRRLRAQRLEQHPRAHQGGHRHVHQYVFNTHLRFNVVDFL